MQANVMRRAFSLLTQKIDTATLFKEAPARTTCTMLVQHCWLHNRSLIGCRQPKERSDSYEQVRANIWPRFAARPALLTLLQHLMCALRHIWVPIRIPAPHTSFLQQGLHACNG